MRFFWPIAACLLLLGACEAPPGGSQAAHRSPSRLDQILASGELRVGLSGNQPPLNMKNVRGEIVGLEVDLIQELAGSMGLKVRFVEMPFAQLLPALESNKVDLVISGMTITPERNARAAFAGPYLVSGKSVLSRSEEISDVETAEALDRPERTYAALAGSTSEKFVKTSMPSATLVTTPDYDTAVQMVIAGKVDALVADFPICAVSVLRYPEENLSMLVTPFTVEPLGIALPPDDPLFVNLVQNYLRTLENTGILVQLKARWLNDGDWVAELP
jgi:polar amino acid transport system substrate-binding protein